MEIGQQLSLWCVRGALIGFFTFGLSCAMIGGATTKRTESNVWLKTTWTVATVLYVAHVILAFAYFHGWSHQQAYAHTAQVTAEFTGIQWGGGLYVNHLFTLVCVLVCAWLWNLVPAGYIVPNWLVWVTAGFFVFVIFNASVIFVTGPVRRLSLFGFAVLWIVFWLRHFKREHP